MIDLDATLVTAHSGKEGFKGGFGYHPVGTWLYNTDEALGAVLRPGNVGSNTAADHLTLIDAALAQLPDRWRAKPILIRADGAGYSHALISALSLQGLEFSVGDPVTEAIRDAIRQMPVWTWQVACNADGDLREHADVVEITGLLDLRMWTKTCPDMRVIVRRELPHPGATLDAFEIRDGYRYQAFTINKPRGQLAFLGSPPPARTPASRTGSGPGRTPAWVTCSRHENINAVWVELALIAADLLALAQSMLLTDQPDLHRRRAQDTALPAAARRRPHHPRATQSVPAPGRALALGARASQSVQTPASNPALGLTASTIATSHQPTKTRRHRTARRPSALRWHHRHHPQDHPMTSRSCTSVASRPTVSHRSC